MDINQLLCVGSRLHPLLQAIAILCVVCHCGWSALYAKSRSKTQYVRTPDYIWMLPVRSVCQSTYRKGCNHMVWTLTSCCCVRVVISNGHFVSVIQSVRTTTTLVLIHYHKSRTSQFENFVSHFETRRKTINGEIINPKRDWLRQWYSKEIGQKPHKILLLSSKVRWKRKFVTMAYESLY